MQTAHSYKNSTQKCETNLNGQALAHMVTLH